MQLSVIITTYNSEQWLQKVLEGYSNQTERDFEVIIADDGSTEKTKQLIDTFQNQFKFPIVHVWQEDNGFQKSKILNKAILKTNTDYFLFTDGDCIPRKDFVAQHLKYKEEGFFLSGGYFKLPMKASCKISSDNIKTQDCFSISWLITNGVSKTFKLSKLTNIRFFATFMNWLTPTKKTFNGHNTSCFKSDLIAINGFNEEMQYGGLDREVGERLFNFGILSKQIRYSAVCLHLDHKRDYATKETRERNNEIRNFNKKNKIIQIKNGITQLK
ncbi:glycosyltransferase family 2 protein [Flavobacterium sp.]|jgi:glycosyltransferase involved in cell wall biosynthesis|uniref:glycosyltransferase family 2 protein n=1 Tax=Flavobacterium sp. TaxID=239 RepID=UPI0037BE6A40